MVSGCARLELRAGNRTDPGDALAEAEVARGDLERVLLGLVDGRRIAPRWLGLPRASTRAQCVPGGEDVGRGVPDRRADRASAVRAVRRLEDRLDGLAAGKGCANHDERGLRC